MPTSRITEPSEGSDDNPEGIKERTSFPVRALGRRRINNRAAVTLIWQPSARSSPKFVGLVGGGLGHHEQFHWYQRKRRTLTAALRAGIQKSVGATATARVGGRYP